MKYGTVLRFRETDWIVMVVDVPGDAREGRDYMTLVYDESLLGKPGDTFGNYDVGRTYRWYIIDRDNWSVVDEPEA